MAKPVAVATLFVLACTAFGASSSTPNTLRTAPRSEPLLRLPARPADAIGGSEFARRTSGLSGADRDRAVVAELERGNIPSFLGHLAPVKLATHLPDGPTLGATIWVTPDYLAIGSDDDFLYVPLTYHSATMIADRFGSVLPTARMVDAIYEQSAHHLTPAPLPAGPLMCSNFYLEKHQHRIDEQRSGLPLGELISGHKKDLVLTNRLRQLPGRVAIYGWHKAPRDLHPAAEHRPRSPVRRLQPRRPSRQHDRPRRRPTPLDLRSAPGLPGRARPEPRGRDAGSLGLHAPAHPRALAPVSPTRFRSAPYLTRPGIAPLSRERRQRPDRN